MQESQQALQHRVKSLIGVTATVTVHEPGVIPRSEGKAQRVIDKRKHDTGHSKLSIKISLGTLPNWNRSASSDVFRS